MKILLIKLRLLLIILFFPILCFSQNGEIETILKQAYQQQASEKTTDHFNLHFLNDSSSYLSNIEGLKQIMIIRHQKVDIEKQLFYNYKKLEEYKSDYDIEDIHPVQSKSILNTFDIDTVYTSSLHRSKATASLLLGDNFVYESKSFFNELKPGTVNIPLLYLPKSLWNGLNRVFWMFGSKPKASSENRGMAQRRVNRAASFLDQKAKEKGKVLLVAHGYMNHLLRKRLKNMGWMLIEHTGHENLGGSLLVKIKN